MHRTARFALVLASLVALGLALWWWTAAHHHTRHELVLYGNVDLRQVDLPFNDTQRIAAVAVQEGDHVHKGEVLARLDTGRLEPQVAQAEAQAAAQRAAVQRLRNGNRPQEIAQARASLDSAKADAANARRQYERLRQLAQSSSGRAASRQDLDTAQAALDVADAKLVSSQKALDLEVAGPRHEDILQAEAQLQAAEAQASYLRQQLADATLVAPTAGIVRSRLMEPGEIAAPTKPVFTLAITDPKWVRAYVSGTQLGLIRSGETATVTVDSFPDRHFAGWIGFISPVAEFTPKTIQTEELRSSLVYEVRVFVKDPADELRLGMPATVTLPLGPDAADKVAAGRDGGR
jgi:HlyD family secretion protein